MKEILFYRILNTIMGRKPVPIDSRNWLAELIFPFVSGRLIFCNMGG